MAIAQEPDGSVEDLAYSLPFSDADREQLVNRAPHVTELMDLAAEVCRKTGACGSLGSREVLAALRALEVARRSVEKASADMLAAYGRSGDSAAHGYRTTAGLLAGEFRITTGEVRKRLHLSEQLTDRITETGEKLAPKRPEVAREFAEGRISADEARSLCDAVESLPPAMAAQYEEKVEKTLVELAPTVRLKDIPALCNRIIQHVDPDGALPAFKPEPHKYNVTLAQQRNGDWRLRGLLGGQTGTTLHALLYGRMKDADVPVTVKPHAGCKADAGAAGPAGAAGEAAGEAPGEALGPSHVADSGEPESGDPAAGKTAAGYPDAGRVRGASGPRNEAGADEPGRSADDDARTSEAGCTADADARDHGSDAPDDGDDYSGPATGGDEAIPRIPLEAVWESTKIVVGVYGSVENVSGRDENVSGRDESVNGRIDSADGRVEIEGHEWVLIEEELPFVFGSDGWPRLLPERIDVEVRRLLTEARIAEAGQAESVLWAKIAGRLPTEPLDGDDPTRDDGPLCTDGSSRDKGRCSADGSPAGDESPGDGISPPRDGPPGPADWGARAEAGDAEFTDPWPRGGLSPSGVREDGRRSDTVVTDDSASTPGIARHDRFAFLLRCLARERVLHGADHALVITARPGDLTRPHSLLTTHTGTPVTLAGTEQWSNAAQTFLHLLDGNGRTVQIRSQGRFATRTQMAVLAARDQGCTFPDCDAPAEWCEAHHIVPWARGGETTVDNLTLLCPFHHRWFEGSGWESTFRNGLPAWTPPSFVDRRRRPLFHARFRVALLNLQATLWPESG